MRDLFTGSAFHHSGGDVIHMGRPLAWDDIAALATFFANMEGRCLAKGDVEGQRHCRRALEQLEVSADRARDWRRAA